MLLTTRLATLADVPALNQLIKLSVRRLGVGHYTPAQLESALKYVFGVDTQLVVDGTYFVAEAAGQVLGCGGWSQRNTLYGGDQHKTAADSLLDPTRDFARIRAFFVHPDAARRGVGRAILQTCEAAAQARGFRGLELAATPPGEPFYAAHGYEVLERLSAALPDGEQHPIVRMAKRLP